MKRRLAIVAAALLILGIGTAIAFRMADNEPQIEGRPLSAWVDDLRRGTSQQKGRAMAVLKGAGPEAASYLAEGIAKKPGLIDRASSRVSKHVPEKLKAGLRKIYNPGKAIIDKHTAAQALQLMGTNAQSAIPALGSMLNDPNVLLSISASRALAEMGPAAVEPLTQALNHGDFNVRGSACAGLAQLGPSAAPAAPRLAQIIASEVGPIVSSAGYALSRIGDAAVPLLVPLLQDTNASIRRQVAFTFASMGARGGTALPALLSLVEDPSPQVRAAAIDALGRIDPVSRRISSAAGEALDDPEPLVRGAALQTLRSRPRYVREHSERIAALLEDESPEVQGYAALALTAAPDEANRWLPKLNELAAGTNATLQASANEALRVIEGTRSQRR